MVLDTTAATPEFRPAADYEISGDQYVEKRG